MLPNSLQVNLAEMTNSKLFWTDYISFDTRYTLPLSNNIHSIRLSSNDLLTYPFAHSVTQSNRHHISSLEAQDNVSQDHNHKANRLPYLPYRGSAYTRKYRNKILEVYRVALERGDQFGYVQQFLHLVSFSNAIRHLFVTINQVSKEVSIAQNRQG